MTTSAIPVAQQARSRHTQERILQAAWAVVAERGVDALTIGAIAERAGVAVGSVYRRFGDKDRLLLAVQQAFADRMRDEVTARLDLFDRAASPSARETIAHLVDALVTVYRTHENVLRVFMVLGLQNRTIFQAGSRASIESKHTAEDFLREVDVRHDDRAAAVDFAFRLLYAVLAHRVTQGEHLESDRPLSWDDLATHLTTTIAAYLLADPALS